MKKRFTSEIKKAYSGLWFKNQPEGRRCSREAFEGRDGRLYFAEYGEAGAGVYVFHPARGISMVRTVEAAGDTVTSNTFDGHYSAIGAARRVAAADLASVDSDGMGYRERLHALIVAGLHGDHRDVMFIRYSPSEDMIFHEDTAETVETHNEARVNSLREYLGEAKFDALMRCGRE